MKKILTFSCIALALLSCTRTKTDVQTVALSSQRDSVNYALGYVHGIMNRNVVGKDTTDQSLKVFMAAFDRIESGAMQKYSTSYRLGYNLGLGVVHFETAGLSSNPKWPLDKDMLLQGFVAGCNQDTTILTYKGAQRIRARANATPNDTLNYAFGWSSGYSFARGRANDSTFCVDECLAGINDAWRKHPKQPEVISAAYKLGMLTAKWQEKGLDGKNFPYNNAIFRQALVNGLQQDTTMMRFDVAAYYLNETLPACLPPALKRRL